MLINKTSLKTWIHSLLLQLRDTHNKFKSFGLMNLLNSKNKFIRARNNNEKFLFKLAFGRKKYVNNVLFCRLVEAWTHRSCYWLRKNEIITGSSLQFGGSSSFNPNLQQSFESPFFFQMDNNLLISNFRWGDLQVMTTIISNLAI